MIAIPQAFPASYAQARVNFLEGAAAAGLSLHQYTHPLKGLQGEELAVDVALDGAPDADRLLIVSSGCHGVEGFCGSGVQVFALHDDEWRAHARAQGIAVLYVHALNPYGFSFKRRVTNENVDLNRNFVDFSQPLPANPGYADLHPVLLPAQWPPTVENQQALAQLVKDRGMEALQAIISRGQHECPDGLFFGGTAPTWSHQTVRRILREHASRARQLAWVDVHTGLGANGYCERIYFGRNEAQDIARARRWWSGDGATPVTVVGDAQSASAVLTGQMYEAAYLECPQAQHTGIALEFGTLPVLQVMQALRGDHWLHLHPEASAELADRIRAQTLAAFYDDSDAWKGQIIAQSRQALFQAVDGLSA